MHEREDSDRLIGEIARQLKHPVALDPALGTRTMAEINRASSRSRRPIAWIGVGLAAGLAAIGVYLTRGGVAGAGDQRVSFSLEAPTASRVSLVGDFNNWDPSATPLERVSSDGRWETSVPLNPGRYQFTYVIDGSRWVRDPGLPPATGDDFGQPTSVITVPGHGRS